MNSHSAKMLCRFFDIELDLIARLTAEGAAEGDGTPEESRLRDYKKALVLSLLDGLANLALVDAKGNRDRFEKLLIRFSEWTEAEMVSLPVLLKRLQALESSNLLPQVEKRVGTLNPKAPGSVLTARIDLTVRRVLALGDANPEETEVVEKTRHVDLFYSYRNFLLHEFRPPGYGMESMGAPAEPSYHATVNDPTWSLVYPLGFFISLARNVIRLLQNHFVTEGIDPYHRLERSWTW